MLDSLSLPLLCAILVGAAVVVYRAGISLASTTGILSDRWHLGQALGGLVLLAIVTNLPEMAIVTSASLNGNLDMAVGNILGGIAVQTLVLVFLDYFGLGRRGSLSGLASSPDLILEGIMVIGVLVLVLMGTQLPGSAIVARVTPPEALIALAWIGGIWVLGKTRPAESRSAPAPGGRKKIPRALAPTLAVFIVAAVATLVGGVALERSSDVIADRLGMSGILFGATVLAICTSLPELATGMASIRLKRYRMAFSDIIGGNAFLPVLFLWASLLSGQAVLPDPGPGTIYIIGLGMLLTAVYLVGLVLRSGRQVGRMGVDSLIVLVLYGLGVLGLVLVV